MSWEAIAGVAGVVVAMTGGIFVFLWRLNNRFRDTTDTLRNDIAWVNEDLGKVQKDVEWLVWFFKKDQER